MTQTQRNQTHVRDTRDEAAVMVLHQPHSHACSFVMDSISL